MSDTDPYAAPEEATPVYSHGAPVVSSEAPSVSAQEISVVEAEPLDVPEGSIKTVLAWVGDDKAKASAALDAEKDGQKRTTLTKELEDILAS